MPIIHLFCLLLTLVTISFPSAAQVTEAVDLDLYSQVLYVSVQTGSDVSGIGSQTNPYQTIQRAIADASMASETAIAAILVASGTYTSISTSVIQMTPWIHLYGGYESNAWGRDISVNETVLDGENERIVVTGASHILMDGFVVTRGSKTSRGAVLFTQATSAALSNCTVKENGLSTPTSGLYAEKGSLHVRKCSFLNNQAAYGAGICLLNTSATINKCRIIGNVGRTGGGGIMVTGSSSDISSCTITNNSISLGSGGGIGLEATSNTSVTNCVIAGNSSYSMGGGIFIRDSQSTISNCTLYNNYSFRNGSGVAFRDCSPSIYNSILYNQGDEIFKYSTGTPTVRYSCIQGGYSGEGNIGSYPHFQSPTEGHFQLSDGSPCIDSGSVSFAPTVDIEGKARPGGDNNVDMGAYESVDQFEGGHLSDPVRLYVNQKSPLGGTGLNWEQAIPFLTDALSMVPSGSDIWVASGTYSGPVKLVTNTSLYGGFAGTEIDLSERNSRHNRSIIVANSEETYTVMGSEETLLDGFTITNPESISCTGLYYGSISSATVSNCFIDGNNANEDWTLLAGGFYCSYASPHIVNSTFSNNVSIYSGGAVNMEHSSPVFEMCYFTDNYAQSGGAISCSNSSAIFRNCIMTRNTAVDSGSCISCAESTLDLVHCTIAENIPIDNAASCLDGGGSTVRFLSCILWNRGQEIGLDPSTTQATYSCIQGGWPGTGNISSYPNFTDPQSGNWTLLDGSPCIDSGSIDLNATTDIMGNPRPGSDGKVDIGAFEGPSHFLPEQGTLPDRIYVNSSNLPGGNGLSWNQALPSISEGLWLASGETDIWVATGIYHETIQLEPGVKLYGGFSGTEENIPAVRGLSTIDVTLYSHQPVVKSAENAHLDHFKITGEFLSGYGAIYFNQITSATVTDCLITGNNSSNGGGIYCTASSPTIAGCTISNNTTYNGGGGIRIEKGSSPHFVGCTIHGNSTINVGGGGIYCTSSSPIFEQCTISGNSSPSMYGGAIYSYFSNPLILANCVISENSCGKKGGAIYSVFSNKSLSILNCTLVSNQSGDNDGAISSYDSPLSISNSILFNNAEEIYYSGRGTPVVHYSCIQGGYPGEGNIASSPLFKSPGSGDYHLLNGSPCIDSASVTAAPLIDLDGETRPGADGKVDMGAYESPEEYQGDPASGPIRYYVDSEAAPGGTGLSWEEALPMITDAAWVSSGPTEIWVASGTYRCSVPMEAGTSLFGGFTGSETSLSERQPQTNITVIDASGLETSVVTGADNTVIDGFTITGGNSSTGGGISYSSAASATISNCIIKDNSAQAGGAMACEDSNLTLINCIMTGNSAFLAGAGIYSDHSSPNLTHCTIAGNSTGLYAATGIYCTESALTVLDSILWNEGAEIRLDSSTAQVDYSCVQGGWSGVGNITVYPAFVGASTGDWHLSAGSPCIDSGTIDLDVTTDLSGSPRPGGDGKVDMGAYESIDDLTPTAGFSPSRFYVDSSSAVGGDGLSWERAFPSIGEALWLTGGNTEIWLASGDYNEAVWLEPGVAIQGGLAGSEETLPETRGISTIDASFLSPYRPVTAAEGIVLDHLKITGALSSYEGALYFDQVNSATVSNCVITGNTTEYCGGILCAYSSPTLINCDISGNWTGLGGGGLHCDYLSSPHLVGCTISGNHTEFDGGGIYCYLSSPIIEQCTISGNNSLSYGGGILFDSSPQPILTNCLITANSARRSGVMYSSFSNPVLTNCTIAGNITDTTWESMIFDNSAAELTNCIYWANSPNVLQATGFESFPKAFYCDFEGGWTGAGGHNIAVDPLFVGNGNYHLLAASPCIHSGTGPASSPWVPNIDIDGDIRTGPLCDIGVDEYNGPTSIIDWFNY